jgi:hypothetical protein
MMKTLLMVLSLVFETQIHAIKEDIRTLLHSIK